MGGADGRSRGRSRSTKARADQHRVPEQRHGADGGADGGAEGDWAKQTAGRAEKRTKQSRTGGQEDGAEADRRERGWRRQSGARSPVAGFPGPPPLLFSLSSLFSSSLSPRCSDGGGPRGSMATRPPPPPAREASPVRAIFPARADLRSCGVIRRHGRRLGVLGDAIRETVVAR
jgi:hypothetical protein